MNTKLILTQGFQKNTQQFETRATIGSVLGKVNIGNSGCRDVPNLQPSKHCALCKMACSVEERVFIVKTCSYGAVQGQIRMKFNRRHARTRSAVSCLVHKSELTDSGCDNKKGMMGRHRSARTQGNFTRVREELHGIPTRSVPRFSQHQHTESCDGILMSYQDV